MRNANSTGKKNCRTVCAAILPFAKRLLVIGLAIAVATGLGGCMPRGERQIRKYLSEKYPGQEFITINYRTSGSAFSGGDPCLTFYPKGGDPETDQAEARSRIPTDEHGQKGEIRFSDTYFDILIREDFETDVLGMLSDIDLPMKAYSHQTGAFDRTWDSTKTYEDYKKEILAGNESRLGLSIYLLCKDVENREQYAQQIFDRLLSEDGVAFTVHINMFTDETVYNEITRKNCYDLFKEDDKTMFFFHKVRTW